MVEVRAGNEWVNIRIPAVLWGKIGLVAKDNYRSATLEVQKRLEESFKREADA